MITDLNIQNSHDEKISKVDLQNQYNFQCKSPGFFCLFFDSLSKCINSQETIEKNERFILLNFKIYYMVAVINSTMGKIN